MARRIAFLSQRDLVQFKLLPVGTMFLYRGSWWMKTDSSSSCPMRGTPSCRSLVGLPQRKHFPKPRTRVHVTRSSGIAHAALAIANAS